MADSLANTQGRVREWIGPRIIPVFADEVQWSEDSNYEPLMMVQNAGETFMSRQYVPAGVPLPDTSNGQESNDYWVHMSNWNAQVEGYREEVIRYAEEVLTFSGDISDLQNALPTSVFDSENTVDARFDIIEADAWVTALRIAADAVTTAKIEDAAVTTAKIADNAVTSAKLDSTLAASILALNGKKGIVYGDSTAAESPTYIARFANLSGMDITNNALGGTKVTPASWTPDPSKHDLWNILKTLSGADLAGYDYIFLCYGTNEWQDHTHPFDTGNGANRLCNFERALTDCIERILTLNNAIQIVYVAPAFAHRPFGSSSALINKSGYMLQDYTKVASMVCKKYNTGFINLANLTINESNYVNWFYGGGDIQAFVHYNEAMKDRVAEYMYATYPWANKEEIFTVDNFVKICAPFNKMSDDTSNLVNFAPYDINMVPERLIPISAASTYETKESFSITDDTVINFYYVGGGSSPYPALKIYPTDDPTKYTYISDIAGYARCSARFIGYEGNSTITFENMSSTATVRVNNACIGESVFAYNKEFTQGWLVNNDNLTYFSSEFRDSDSVMVANIKDGVLHLRGYVETVSQLNVGYHVITSLPSFLRPSEHMLPEYIIFPCFVQYSGGEITTSILLNQASGQLYIYNQATLPTGSKIQFNGCIDYDICNSPMLQS